MHPRRTALLAVVVVVLAFLTIRAFRARRGGGLEDPALGAGQRNASASDRDSDRGAAGARKSGRDGGRSAIGIGAQD